MFLAFFLCVLVVGLLAHIARLREQVRHELALRRDAEARLMDLHEEYLKAQRRFAALGPQKEDA